MALAFQPSSIHSCDIYGAPPKPRLPSEVPPALDPVLPLSPSGNWGRVETLAQLVQSGQISGLGQAMPEDFNLGEQEPWSGGGHWLHCGAPAEKKADSRDWLP